jgi:hypothetical protein
VNRDSKNQGWRKSLIFDLSSPEGTRLEKVHDTENDSFSVTIRCHDQNGELYNVTFSRDRVTVQSYSDDAILAKVETWADTKPQLA